MDQRIIDLYDHFTHGGMNRRDFMDRLIKLSGSTVAATALLPLLQNNYAQAAVVAETIRASSRSASPSIPRRGRSTGISRGPSPRASGRSFW